jgi:murein DD-endopeptidase MepM/ murein hydrolase activator NlpD
MAETILEYGFTVRMAHLERGSVRVSIGKVVNTGEPLAVMDCTGTCDGPHIHYVMWKAGELVNPKDYGALTDHP